MPVRIVGYAPELRDHFSRLNREWLERWFSLEAVDLEVLGDPQAHIIDDGGQILFAVTDDGSVVGTVALRHEGEGVYELTKMAVEPDRRGTGIGRQLVEEAIDRFEALGGTRLYLESNDRLEAAVSLYESVGFVHAQRGTDASTYGRANVFMEWRPDTP